MARIQREIMERIKTAVTLDAEGKEESGHLFVHPNSNPAATAATLKTHVISEERFHFMRVGFQSKITSAPG